MERPDDWLFYGRMEGQDHLWLSHLVQIAEDIPAELAEAGKYEAVVLGSGMAAETAAILSSLAFGYDQGLTWDQWMSMPKEPKHVLIHEPAYGCKYRLAVLLSIFGIQVQFVNFNDRDALRAAILPNTELLMGESSANPTIRALDISGTADLVRTLNQRGRRRPLRYWVDSTFNSQVGCRPLALGADGTTISLSKHGGGYSRRMGGALIAPGELVWGNVGIHTIREVLGAVLDPSAANEIAATGMASLIVRVKQSEQIAQQVAEALCEHEKVDEVTYVGLPTYPDRDIARVQFVDYDGYPVNGTMLYFVLKAGDAQEARARSDRVVRYLEKKGYAITVCVSLGANKTFIDDPVNWTHKALTPEQLERAGIKPGGMRISIGQESPQYIIDELKAAIAFAYSDAPLSSLDEK
jgi:cystathionine beta-lyase/cystathionine gamma-synthase